MLGRSKAPVLDPLRGRAVWVFDLDPALRPAAPIRQVFSFGCCRRVTCDVAFCAVALVGANWRSSGEQRHASCAVVLQFLRRLLSAPYEPLHASGVAHQTLESTTRTLPGTLRVSPDGSCAGRPACSDGTETCNQFWRLTTISKVNRLWFNQKLPSSTRLLRHCKGS